MIILTQSFATKPSTGSSCNSECSDWVNVWALISAGHREKRTFLYIFDSMKNASAQHRTWINLFSTQQRETTAPSALSKQHMGSAQTLFHPCPRGTGRVTAATRVTIKPSLLQRAQLPVLGIPPCPSTQRSRNKPCSHTTVTRLMHFNGITGSTNYSQFQPC